MIFGHLIFALTLLYWHITYKQALLALTAIPSEQEARLDVSLAASLICGWAMAA